MSWVSSSVALGALAVFLAPVSVAQDHPHPDDAGQLRVDPVVVITSPGPAREADELIGAASVLERTQLVDDLKSSLGDTLDRLPGVASTHFGAAAGRPVLRGLGAERVLVLTNGIGVIDASAASPDHQVAADGIDAERVEVLRGPAALAYGGQAIGGVVNVVDGLIAERTPEEPFSLNLYGAHQDVNNGLEGAARAQVEAGGFVLTVSSSGRDQEDYNIPGFAESDRLHALEEAEHEEGGEEHEEQAEVAGSLPNSFMSTKANSVGLSYVGSRGFIGAAVRQQTATYGLPGHAHGEEHDHEDEHADEDHEDEDHDEHGEESPFIELEQLRFDIRGGLTFERGFIRAISATAAFADYEHTEFEAPGEPGTIYETEGHEARVEADHSLAGFEGAFGVQMLDRTFGATGEEALITPTDTSSIGVFLYETREWDSGFGVEGGVRWDATAHNNDVAGEAEFETFSGSLGLHQHWDNGVFLGGQVSVTERAPNETELFAAGPHLATGQYEVGDAGLTPETGFNLEGVARLKKAEWSVSLSAFATRFDDFIYLAPGMTLEDGMLSDEVDGLPVFQFHQADADFHGGELEGELFLHDVLGADWRIAGNADFVKAELQNGEPVPYVPPVSLNAEADAFFGPWTFGGAVTWADEQNRAGAGVLATDSYVLVDLSMRYDLSTLGLGGEGSRLFLDFQNIGDEEARPATSVIKDVAPLPGRNIRLGFSLTL